MPRDERRRDEDDDRPRRPRRRDEDDDREERPRKSARRREDDEADDYDDVPADRPRKARKGGDGLARVVPYRNGAALAAYYCGVFGLIPFLGFLLGPIAFILGIIGFVKARGDPKARGTGHAIAGIVLGLIDPPLWIVLWFLVFQKLTDPAG